MILGWDSMGGTPGPALSDPSKTYIFILGQSGEISWAGGTLHGVPPEDHTPQIRAFQEQTCNVCKYECTTPKNIKV